MVPLSFACKNPIQSLRLSPPLATIPTTIAYRKGFEYGPLVDMTILRLASAGISLGRDTIMDRVTREKGLQGYFTPKKTSYQCPKFIRNIVGLKDCSNDKSAENEIRRISLHHIQKLFMVYGVGIFISLMTFSLECTFPILLH